MKKKITVILLLMTILLGVLCGINIMSRDSVDPVITVPEGDMIYNAADGEDILLVGVKATDDIDGDISSYVRIYDVAVIGDGTQAVVTYAVYDSSYNLGKASKTVSYVPAEEVVTTEETTTEEEITTEEVTTEEPKEEDDNTEEDTEEENTTEEEELESDGAPVIRLSTHEVRIDVGDNFYSVGYLEEAVDDEDDRSYLFRNVHVDGDYNVNVPGEYELSYYCQDSDGNTSNVEMLTLIVGEEESEDTTEENEEESNNERD